MLKFAGENSDCPFKVMISVNNPFDITMNINLMRGTIYEQYLIKATIKNIINPDTRANVNIERTVFKDMETKFGLNFDNLKQIKTWRDFDE